MEYVSRRLEPAIINTLNDGKIAVLYGPRQVGKTTLARHIASRMAQEYAYLNCDEPDIASALRGKSSTELMRYVGHHRVVVIDEAQRVENIGITLKLLADADAELKIIATGSSSFELANSINEPLTGRAYYFTIWPLGLAEISMDAIEQNRILNDLIIMGSYPVVALRQVSDPVRYLGDLTKNYLYRDLLSYGAIRSEATLVQLLKLLALQVGSQVSLSELSRALGVDFSIVKRLIDLLEKAFVVHRLPPLSANPRSGIRKLSKIYFVDLGIRNYLIGNLNSVDVRPDRGALWENFCINELKKQLSLSSEPVNTYFWRNYAGAEIDFIEEKEGGLFPYEFKWGNKKSRLPKQFRDSFQSTPIHEIATVTRENFTILTSTS